MHIIKHFVTITRHRLVVLKHCFKVGLYLQGLTHDLSKYSLAEFIPGAKFYTGDKSPQVAERITLGYSTAWMHHKGRNKHHFEYWVDHGKMGEIVYAQMPVKYFGEMICDRVAACKIYLKNKYTNSSALEYYNRVTIHEHMNDNTRVCLVYFLNMLAERGEKYTFKQLKKFIKINKKAVTYLPDCL